MSSLAPSKHSQSPNSETESFQSASSAVPAPHGLFLTAPNAPISDQSILTASTLFDESPKNSSQSNQSPISGQVKIRKLSDLEKNIEPDQDMHFILDNHLNSIVKIQSMNAWTLRFHDPKVESAYRSFFLHKVLNTWQRFAILTFFLIIILEIIVFTRVPSIIRVMDTRNYAILNGAGVFSPMVLLILLTFVLKKQHLKNWIHTISTIYLLVLGPVLMCGHYFISGREPFVASISASVFILEIFACVLFFRLGFLHTFLGMLLIAIPAWFIIFSLALKKSEVLLHETQIEFLVSSIALALTFIVATILSYQLETAIRHQFISDQQFVRINTKLNDQLSGLLKGFSNRIADLDSPVEKAIYGIKTLLAGPSTTPEQLRTLQWILTCLNSTNILTPDFDSQMKTGCIVVNDEQKVRFSW